jgi:hypothetical protein
MLYLKGRQLQQLAATTLAALILLSCVPAPTAAPTNTAAPSPTPAAPTATLAQPTLAPATATAPAAGETYSDPAWGYSFNVPAGWEACTVTENSRVYCRAQTEPSGPSFPVFYVTVMPAGFTNDQAEAYNYLPEADVRALVGLAPGESHVLEGNDPEYATFARLPDTAVAGQAGATIENSRVWEGGPDTVDRRVLVTRGDRTYMIGAYYETPEELAAFEAALATLAFTQ